MAKSRVFLFGGISAATFGLGIWQVQRYFWKVNLINNNKTLFNESIEIIQTNNSSSSSSE